MAFMTGYRLDFGNFTGHPGLPKQQSGISTHNVYAMKDKVLFNVTELVITHI